MKRLPSIKTLSRVFSDAKQARRILEMGHAELSATDAGAARIAECFHALNAIEPGLFGLESFQTRKGEYVEYLNAGDTYAPTLIYRAGRYFVGCWGDIAEREA
jgi:hypothetical protein